MKNLPELIILKSGLLTFPEVNLELNPKTLTPKQCRTSLAPYKNGDERDVGTGYFWQYYKVSFGHYPAYLSFCFYGTQLYRLAMDSLLPTDKLQDNWPTEESMLLTIKFYKKMFKQQFGGKLSYGSTYNILDQRSYSPQCGISYASYVKELRYSLEMTKKRDQFTDFVQIGSIGINFHITKGVLVKNTLVSNREEHYNHSQTKFKNEKECLAKVLETIEEYKSKGYKIKKQDGKPIAYDAIDESEL